MILLTNRTTLHTLLVLAPISWVALVLFAYFVPPQRSLFLSPSSYCYMLRSPARFRPSPTSSVCASSRHASTVPPPPCHSPGCAARTGHRAQPDPARPAQLEYLHGHHHLRRSNHDRGGLAGEEMISLCI